MVNGAIVLFAVGLVAYRWRQELIMKGWRKVLSDEEADLLRRVVLGDDSGDVVSPADDSRRGDLELSVGKSSTSSVRDSNVRVQMTLGPFILHHGEIVLHEKVGSGSFGDVFRGEYRNQQVPFLRHYCSNVLRRRYFFFLHSTCTGGHQDDEGCLERIGRIVSARDSTHIVSSAPERGKDYFSALERSLAHLQ